MSAAAGGAPNGTAVASETGTGLREAQDQGGNDPFDEIEWEKRSARITSAAGEALFEQHGVEFPKAWSQQATVWPRTMCASAASTTGRR